MGKIFTLIVLFISFGAYAQANEIPSIIFNCGEGDYLVGGCGDGYVCINGNHPINQRIQMTDEKKGGSNEIISMNFSPNDMVQLEKLHGRVRLYFYDYPDRVHPRLIDRVSCNKHSR